MTTVREINKTTERMEDLRGNCKRLEMFAIDSDHEFIKEIEDQAQLGIPLHIMCEEIQAVLEAEISRMQKAVENAEVDIELAFHA